MLLYTQLVWKNVGFLMKNSVLYTMVKKEHKIFLFLVILALLIIIGDYVYGHMGENPFKENNCILCSAFNSFEPGLLLEISFLFFGLLLIHLLNNFKIRFSTISLYIAIISPRSPPYPYSLRCNAVNKYL